jgi:hypothetical protein
VLHLFAYLGIGRAFAPNGTSIPWMVPFWLLGLAILFPLCWGYEWLKHRQSPRSVLRFV